MTRLTRAESQARTREQLLATARELFLRDGYLATSLDKVADTAGFSKGAVYSNFRNKDQLCLAVLDEIRAERAAEVSALLTAPTVEDRLHRFEEWAERVIGDPQWTTLEFEFAVQARRDPVLRQELATRLAAVGEVVQSAVAGLMTSERANDAASRDATTSEQADSAVHRNAVTSGHADHTANQDAVASRRGDSAAHRNAATSRHADNPTNPYTTTSGHANHARNRDAATSEHADVAVNSDPIASARADHSASRDAATSRHANNLDAITSVRADHAANLDAAGAVRAQPPMETEEAAVALLCLGVGLGLFRSIEPGMPVSALVSTVRVLAGLPARG